MKNKSKRRPPICAVLGHIDSGKTSFLDLLRKSKVTDKEDGGITQKIGITHISSDQIKHFLDIKNIKKINNNHHLYELRLFNTGYLA